MKKIIALTFVFLVVLSAVPAFAAEPGGTYGQLKYSISDGKVTITGTTDTTDDHDTVIDVVIPDTIDDLPVVAIGNDAFYRCAAMKSIKLPESLEKIGNFAFCFCVALESVEIPEGVELIGTGAFGSCSSLKELVIPEGLEFMGDNILSGCSSLTYIKVPSKFLTYPALFKGLSSVEEIDISGSGLKMIPNEFFMGMTALKSVKLPDGLETIGSMAFCGCASLKSIDLPETVNEIYNGAFSNSGLETFTVPSGVKALPASLFYNCTALKSVLITSNVNIIGDSAFSQCTALEEIDLSKVNSIQDFAFLRCSSLKTVRLSDKNVLFGVGIFEECNSLKDVYYDGNKKSWDDRFAGTFEELNVNVHIKIPFSDVSNGKWYTDGVLFCYDKGYMNGVGDGKFNPGGTFTRAMFVQVLAKIDGVDLTPYTGSSFNDVKAGKWYAKATQWAYMTGYASGTGNGYFSPNAPVTREMLAQFLYNYSKKLGFDVSKTADLSAYTDADKISPWAKKGMSWAIANELITGTTATTLNPKGNASRSQVALIVKKFYTGVYLLGSAMTRNGMRAEVGAYVSKIPVDGNEKITGGAYLRIFKPADSDIDFHNVTVNAKLILKGLTASTDLPYDGVVHESGDFVYAEYAREFSGSLGFVPFKAGDLLDVEITVTVNSEPVVLTYKVPVLESLFVKE